MPGEQAADAAIVRHGRQLPQGAQFGIGDAPTNGEAANRPKMNAARAGGLQRRHGSLQERRPAPVRRINSRRRRRPIRRPIRRYYSLGVVRERSNETAAALTAYRQAITIVADYEPAIAAYAVLLARTGKAEDAAEFLKQRQAQMPKSAAVSAAMAKVKSIQGDSGERSAWLKKRSSSIPTTARRWSRSRETTTAHDVWIWRCTR